MQFRCSLLKSRVKSAVYSIHYQTVPPLNCGCIEVFRHWKSNDVGIYTVCTKIKLHLQSCLFDIFLEIYRSRPSANSIIQHDTTHSASTVIRSWSDGNKSNFYRVPKTKGVQVICQVKKFGTFWSVVNTKSTGARTNALLLVAEAARPKCSQVFVLRTSMPGGRISRRRKRQGPLVQYSV